MHFEIEGESAPRSSAEHAADRLVSIQHTPADVSEEQNKFKRSRSQCFATGKKWTFERETGRKGNEVKDADPGTGRKNESESLGSG